MTSIQQEAEEHFIISHGGQVRIRPPSIDNPFEGRVEFTTPDGTVRPMSEFCPSLFRVAPIRAQGERIITASPTAGPIVEPFLRVPRQAIRRPSATQARNSASGRVTPVRSNTVQARNRNIYKLRGVLDSIIPLIPSDVYSDDFTQADVQALIDSVSSALDRKRKHDFICEPCLKSINNGKSAKSTAHNHSGNSCCKCGSDGPVVFRIHKDRLARLEAQSQS